MGGIWWGEMRGAAQTRVLTELDEGLGVCGGGSQLAEVLSLCPPVSQVTHGDPAGRATVPLIVMVDGTLSLSAWHPQAEETRPLPWLYPC